MTSWLILTYTLPTEPSALRVGIWRKLKRLGALLHQDALWILPANSRTHEKFQWLAAEIVELGGQVSFWEASLVMGIEEETLIHKFQEQIDERYQSLLEQLEKDPADIATIARQYQQWMSKDYFHSELGKRLRNRLLVTRGDQV
jgi:hypothetical protein